MQVYILTLKTINTCARVHNIYTHTHTAHTHTHTRIHIHTHSHMQGYQTQLSSLQRQRRELQQALQSAHPGAAAYQRQRQQFKDSIIGLAASLAGLRSNMTYGAQAGTKAREAIHTNTKALEVRVSYRGYFRKGGAGGQGGAFGIDWQLALPMFFCLSVKILFK